MDGRVDVSEASKVSCDEVKEDKLRMVSRRRRRLHRCLSIIAADSALCLSRMSLDNPAMSNTFDALDMTHSVPMAKQTRISLQDHVKLCLRITAPGHLLLSNFILISIVISVVFCHESLNLHSDEGGCARPFRRILCEVKAMLLLLPLARFVDCRDMLRPIASFKVRAADSQRYPSLLH